MIFVYISRLFCLLLCRFLQDFLRKVSLDSLVKIWRHHLFTFDELNFKEKILFKQINFDYFFKVIFVHCEAGGGIGKWEKRWKGFKVNLGFRVTLVTLEERPIKDRLHYKHLTQHYINRKTNKNLHLVYCIRVPEKMNIDWFFCIPKWGHFFFSLSYCNNTLKEKIEIWELLMSHFSSWAKECLSWMIYQIAFTKSKYFYYHFWLWVVGKKCKSLN